MALTAAALADTRHAFDGVAGTYHETNRANPLIGAMRARTMDRLLSGLRGESHLLDLGCGPGDDAVMLAATGHHIVAVDWSPAMAAEARRRAAHHGVAERVDVRTLGIHELDRLAPRTFDAAYSNLGPLNCVPDLAATAAQLARLIRPGGVFVASVIGRVCPWEIARYAGAGEFRRAGIRLARGFVPVPLEGRTIWTRYYEPAEFERIFARAGFDRVSRRALGLFTPPPYLDAFASRHPRTVAALQWLDDVAGGWSGLNRCGDHFLVTMARP